MVRGTRAEAEAMWGQILDRAERLTGGLRGKMRCSHGKQADPCVRVGRC